MESASQKALAQLEDSGLAEILAKPDSPLYNERVQSYWSITAQLKPWAVLLPRSSDEVAACVRTLVEKTDCHFAVRSGGHTNWAGSNGIRDGVTVDLGRMTATSYNPETRLASILPGARWSSVYGEVEKYGVMVSGGREGNVGVGGFLTGGGNAHFTCRTGFGCDNVVNYEVVLADGSIIQVNAKSHPDLFVALKGGSNNFGIVTRFDHEGIWGGAVFWDKTNTEALVKAFMNFARSVPETRDSSFVGMWCYMPEFNDITVMGLVINLDGEERGRPFEEFLAMPAMQQSLKMTTMSKTTTEYALPKGEYNVWFTVSFKLDERIIRKFLDLHEKLVDNLKQLIPEGNFSTQAVLQPLPAVFAQQSVARGSNILGLERVEHDSVLILLTAQLPTPELEKAAYSMMRAVTDEVETLADSLDARTAFRYLNYCDFTQDPLGSYGEENVRKMREVAAKYDPAGVFQTRVPGGFKLSKVQVGK